MGDIVIKELGGGAPAVIVVMLLSALGVLALVIRTLWVRLMQERDKTSEMQSACSKDLRELHLSTLKTLNDVDRSVSSLATAMNERRRENEK